MTRCHTGTFMELQARGIDDDTAWQIIRGRTDEEIASILANLRSLPGRRALANDVRHLGVASREQGRELDD